MEAMTGLDINGLPPALPEKRSKRRKERLPSQYDNVPENEHLSTCSLHGSSTGDSPDASKPPPLPLKKRHSKFHHFIASRINWRWFEHDALFVFESTPIIRCTEECKDAQKEIKPVERAQSRNQRSSQFHFSNKKTLFLLFSIHKNFLKLSRIPSESKRKIVFLVVKQLRLNCIKHSLSFLFFLVKVEFVFISKLVN